MEQPTTESLTAFLVTHDASDSMQNSCITILTYTAAAMEVKMARGSITMVVVLALVVLVMVVVVVMVKLLVMVKVMMRMLMFMVMQMVTMIMMMRRTLQ